MKLCWLSRQQIDVSNRETVVTIKKMALELHVFTLSYKASTQRMRQPDVIDLSRVVWHTRLKLVPRLRLQDQPNGVSLTPRKGVHVTADSHQEYCKAASAPTSVNLNLPGNVAGADKLQMPPDSGCVMFETAEIPSAQQSNGSLGREIQNGGSASLGDVKSLHARNHSGNTLYQHTSHHQIQEPSELPPEVNHQRLGNFATATKAPPSSSPPEDAHLYAVLGSDKIYTKHSLQAEPVDFEQTAEGSFR